jgi:hypothetical protein
VCVTALESSASSEGEVKSPETVDLVEFLKRLDTTGQDEWDDLREACGAIEEYLRDAAVLEDIIGKATNAVAVYSSNLNKTYVEWYGGETPPAPAPPIVSTAMA